MAQMLLELVPSWHRSLNAHSGFANGQTLHDLRTSGSKSRIRSVAELALSVVDAYQRRGIGKLLLECLIGMARYEHVSRLEADVLESNRGAMRFLIGRGFKSTGTAGGVSRLALSVETMMALTS